MTNYEQTIVDYMQTRSPNPLGYKNISKNTGIARKYVFRTLVRSNQFHKVSGQTCGSAKLGKSYFVLST